MDGNIFNILDFTFSSFSFEMTSKNIITKNTKDKIKNSIMNLNCVCEKFLVTSNTKQVDMEKSYRKFMTFAAKGDQDLFDNYKTFKDINILVNILSFSKDEKMIPIIETQFFSKALKIIETCESTKLCRMLIFLLLSNWNRISLMSKNLLQESIKKHIKLLQTNNKIISYVIKKQDWFLSDKGSYLLAKKIVDFTLNDVKIFLSYERTFSSDNILGIPLFISPSITPGYFYEVLLFYTKLTIERDIIDQFLEPVFLLLQNKCPVEIARRIMVNLILWIDANKTKKIIVKETIKEKSISIIGDPQDSTRWGPWKGITEKENIDLQKAKKILDQWISEYLINIFFERLISDKDRREFWRQYAKNFTVKILANETDYQSMKKDPRVISKGFTRFGKLKGIGSVLVMLSEKYVLIEFSTIGNAFYAYRRENLQSYGLKKLEELIESDAVASLSVFDIKRTDMQNLHINEEGRFVHTSQWQYKLKDWIKTTLGVQIL